MENTKLNHYSVIDSYKTYVNMFIFMFLFYLGFTILIVLIGDIIKISYEEMSADKHFIYIQGFVSPLMFCSLFLWQNRKKKYNTSIILGVNKKLNWKAVCFAIGLAVFCLIFFASFSTMIDSALELIGFNPEDSLNLVRENIGYLFLNLLVFALLPAIFEELIFRGIIFNGLNKEHTAIFAILVSALMFSLMHGSLQQTIFQFIIGVSLGLVMYATHNIIYPIILHFTNNAIVVIIDFFTYTEESVSYIFNVWSILVPIILALLGLCMIIFLFKKVINTNKESNNLVIKKKFLTYSLNEKIYAICGFAIAIFVWIANTITMFIGA